MLDMTTDPFRSTFDRILASKVRAAVAEKRVTQVALATAISATRKTLSRKMNGKSPFGASELERIGQILGVPASELMRRAEAETERALADGAPTSPAPEETQSTNPAAAVAAGPHTEVE